ncbi:MAG: topoisomerase II [Planctomycetes bacterium]|nr:topoisomerase II [Planctomycetota bacterium]MCW8134463.1 topoisomerase II [Planctomycetota bacterium]
MARKKSPQQQILDDLDDWLESRREHVLELVGGDRSIHSFHGVIGGKNNTYADAVNMEFRNPDEFLAVWKEGLHTSVVERDRRDKQQYGRALKQSAAHRLVGWLKIPAVREYVETFLTRNFFREYVPRVRKKPASSLWEIWFGENDHEYGLLIAPRWDATDGWHNDVSEIRRAKFRYWTIGHLLTSGLVVSDNPTPHKFDSLDRFLDFYRDVLVRPTRSVHGRTLAKKYAEYLKAHANPQDVPLLIPEFRHAGLARKHRYRLDFTLLSADHNFMIGVELSPWSTHGRTRSKAKAKAEQERKEKWQHEMQKRNDYFSTFGITTLTFLDDDLADVARVLKRLDRYLAPRAVTYRTSQEMDRVMQAYSAQ